MSDVIVKRASSKQVTHMPLWLKPIWVVANFMSNLGRFHEGKITPLKSGLVGYLLFSKVLLSIPITLAAMLSWPALLFLFFNFARVNVMMYSATRVIKSINVNVKNKKRRVRTLIGVGTLLFLDAGIAWVSFAYLLHQSMP